MPTSITRERWSIPVIILKIHKLPPHEYKYPSLYRDGLTRGSTLVGFYTHLNNPRLY
jgi:hypothetical protein